MRAKFLAVLGFGLLAFAGNANAGLLELKFDEISLDRHCDTWPCHGNDLAFRKKLVKAPWYDYRIKSSPPKYRYVRRKIKVYDGGWEKSWLFEKPHVAGVAPVHYEVVTEQVLVRPAKHRVYRNRPYSAYFTKKTVVRDSCTKDLFGYCF